MIFSKLLPRKASFAVTIIAGICFVIIAIVNLDLPVADILLQLTAIALLIIFLIVGALLVAYLIHRLVRKPDKGKDMDEERDDEAS